MASKTHRNRLGDEKSPYLLQHASNPVDWYEVFTSCTKLFISDIPSVPILVNLSEQTH